MKSEFRNFIERLKLLMAEKGMGVSELSNAADLQRTGLSRILNGKTEPKPATIGKLAKALGVNPSALMGSGIESGEVKLSSERSNSVILDKLLNLSDVDKNAVLKLIENISNGIVSSAALPTDTNQSEVFLKLKQLDAPGLFERLNLFLQVSAAPILSAIGLPNPGASASRKPGQASKNEKAQPRPANRKASKAGA